MKLQAEKHTDLHESSFIIAISWDADQKITQVFQEIPAFTQYSVDKSYVPSYLCDALISWGHILLITVHPGVTK